jgi:hypothetical protein
MRASNLALHPWPIREVLVPMRHGALWLAAVAAGVGIATPAPALGNASGFVTEPHKAIVFSPDRPDRCDYFFVTEFSTGITGVKSQDGADRFLFTDALGLMRNIDRTRAVGVSIDAHLTAGALRVAPTLRFKQWLAGRSSLDLSLGYAHTSIVQEGVVGPIVDVRYSPTAWFHVQAGACRIRTVSSIFYFPDLHVDQSSRVEFYAGAGLGGVPGVISWGAQAIGAVGLALALGRMD